MTTATIAETDTTPAADLLHELADEQKVRFAEEEPIILSDRDRDLYIDMLENPPPPNEALIEAMRRHRDGR